MLAILLGLQFTTPFGSELPESAMLVPHHPHLAFKRELKAYPQILQRPIFAPDRQPMLETMTGYSLLGVGIAGPLSTAIVQTTSGRMTRVKPGDRLAGWQISSITSNYLFFQRSKERRMLKLDMTRLYASPKAGEARPGAVRFAPARTGVR